MLTELNKDMDNQSNYLQNGSNKDLKSVIHILYGDKLKLLKEQKILYALLIDKDEQILKISEHYKKKWETVCEQLRNIDKICMEVNNDRGGLLELRIMTDRLLNSAYSSPSTMMESSISSICTATDTTECTVSTTSSESLVANHMTGTLTKFTDFQSENSLNNDINTPHRSHSDCLKDNNDCPRGKSGFETDTSEYLSQVTEDNIRRSKKKSKKISNKNEKQLQLSEPKMISNKPISEFSNQEVYNWLLNVARLPKLLVEDIKMKNKINGHTLDQVTEQKFDKLFGTSDKLIKRKVFLALEDYKSDEYTVNVESNDLYYKDHLWVANIWLKKHLGLTDLSAAFLTRCIDGKLLKFIAKNSHSKMKEFISLASINYESLTGISVTPISNVNRAAIPEPSKSDLRSLRFGLELFVKFDFDISELEKRRAACEDLNTDVLVWTNERFAKWFQQHNLKSYIRGIEYSGIHGGLVVLDPNFSVSTIFKLLQIPSEIVKKNNLDEKLSILLKPSRFNEGVKSSRSTSIFRRRSFSQPRYSKSIPTKSKIPNATPDISDSASNNDSMTITIHTNYNEKCQTLDSSQSSLKNQNFIRTYRKPYKATPKINITDSDSAEAIQNNVTVPHHFTKSPPLKFASQFPFQIARKLKERTFSNSENDDDYEI